MTVLTRRHWLVIVLIVCLLIEPTNSKRGGGGAGRSRGASAGRSGGGFGSASRSRAGAASGGYRPSSGSSFPRGNYGVGSNTGMGGTSWMGGNKQRNDFGHRSGSSSGGLFGSSSGSRPRYNKGSGLGSMVRSNTFKNAIVGAAAGYLTYQAGKHLIRSAMAPMMWNNRPYYWGSNYYQSRPGQSMCRMPIDSNDPQFGNVYFQDHTRPREIVWSCGYNEVCCGSECCPQSYGNSYGGGYFGPNHGYRNGLGIGSLLILLLLSVCGLFLVYRMCGNRNQYQQGRANAVY